jgi:hypothetical protein
MRTVLVIAVLLASLSWSAAATAQSCTFVLGFKDLRDRISEIVGDCLTDAVPQPNGDVQQLTDNGLLVWRKADNWTAFTDGATTWINGPLGIQARPNHQRFSWELCLGVPAYPEVRPQNAPYNATAGRPIDFSRSTYAYPEFQAWLESKEQTIDGLGCVGGTTEQILEFYARKWFGDAYPDLAKAMAVRESHWDMAEIDAFPGDGGISFGILQVKDNGTDCCWPDGHFSRASTAYGADYAMAVVRYHYEGASWLGAGTQGSIRDAVAAWFCGCGNDGDGAYATFVFTQHETKPWRQPGF